MERNRRAAAVTAQALRSSVQEHIPFLDQPIVQTTQPIRGHIDGHPTLQPQRDLLTSIPGRAQATAARLLAQLLDVTQFSSSRQVAAFAGLVHKCVDVVPRIRESGTWVRESGTWVRESGTWVRGRPSLFQKRERRLRKGKSRMLIVGAGYPCEHG
jgi:transposase